MKFRLRLIIVIALFSSCTFGNNLLREKVETLNSHSIELLGLSILEVTKLSNLSSSGNFAPLEALEGNGDMQILEGLEKKGYLSIEVMNERLQKMIGYDIPLDKNYRHITLSSKGRDLLEAIGTTSI